MKLNLLHHLRNFLLLFALLGLAGCWPEFKGAPDDGNNDGGGDDTEEPVDLPDPPVFANGKFFGTAADAPQDDADAITAYFNQITPENAGKWGSVEATRDVMNWDELDAAYEFAQNYGVPFKFHTLVWGQQQPTWIDALTPAEQLEEIEEWFSEVAARYPGIDLIDVVNEPINAQPTYKNALGGDGITGWDWVIAAFQMARQHFPNAELILNEYRVLQTPEFTQDYMEIVSLLQAGDLIDAIGEEGHFLEQTDPGIIESNLDTLATTGLPIYITEFDVNFADDARHANVLRDLFTVFWEHPGVEGVTHWGYRQGTTWRPEAYLLLTDDTERPGMVWLDCYINGGGNCTVPTYTPPGWQGDANGLTLEAELYDEGSGLIALGGVVAYTSPGDWISFHSVQFQNTWNTLSVTYAKGDDDDSPAASISIHVGSLSNPASATIVLPSTGGWGVFDTLEVNWPAQSTTQDVYISFNNDADAVANIDNVRFFEDVAPGGNVVTNGDFETNTSGWDTFGNGNATLSTSTTYAYSGNQSLRVAGAPRINTNGYAAYNLTSAVEPDTLYSVRARVYHDSGSNTTIRMAAKIDCSTATMPVGFNEFPWLHNNTAVASDTWTELSAVMAIPDCDLVDVVVYFEGTPTTVNNIYIDAVSVLALTNNLVANSDFETNTSGWDTFGNANASLSASPAQFYTGIQSLLVTGAPRVNTNGYAAYNLTSAVEPDTVYAVRAPVYHASGSNTTIRLAAKIDCSTATMPVGFNEFPWLHNNTAVATATWTELSGTLTIPDCDLVDVVIYFEGTPVGVNQVFIDAVRVLGP